MKKLATILSLLLIMLTACHYSAEELTPPFARSDIIPGKTTAGEVDRIMGKPDDRSVGVWSYNILNHTQVMTFFFEKDKVEEIWLSISDFSLGDLVDQLGDPEIVELIIAQPNIGFPIYPQKIFHYPSLGVSYYSPCGEDCQHHHPTDTIEHMSQYAPSSQPEFRQKISSDSEVIKWRGFQK